MIKRRQLLNMIDNNRSIFLSDISKESKRFAWGRQTAFEDILEEDVSQINWNEFMQKIFELDMKGLMLKGLKVVFGDDLS